MPPILKAFVPIAERSWSWDRNQIVAAAGSAAATTKAVFLLAKSRLKALAVAPLTVLGSSNSTVAALDGVDRIVDAATLVNATSGAHSWVLFRHPGTGMQLCWDFNGDGAWKATLVASLAGFTGGSTTARPTATDQQILINNDYWVSGDNLQHVLHILHAGDGAATVLFVCNGGDAKTFVVLGKAFEAVAGWSTPVFAFARGEGNSASGHRATQWEYLYKTPGLASWGPGGLMTLYASTYSDRARANGASPSCVDANVVDPLTGKYPAQPMALLSVTAGRKGRHGRLPDLWFTAPSAPNGFFNGDSKFLKIGDYVIPWGGGPTALFA
jgi:hypothetical protein